MPRKRKIDHSDDECGTLLVLSHHHASDDFLAYVREQEGALNWELVDRWTAQGTGYLVMHMGADGGNHFELVAWDADELLGTVLDQAAKAASDVRLTQAGGIGSQETLEAINARWVALGGVPNPQFDRSISLH